MGDVLVLAYHAVSDSWPAPLAVTRRALREQLAWLAGRGYRSVTAREAVLGAGAGRTVAITFDDAYGSVLDVAFPALAEVGFRATVFAPTDFVGRPAPMSWAGIDAWVGSEHEHELRCLSWRELDQLAHAGWEIGSHTCSHPHLTRVGHDRLRDELVRSRATCEEHLGRPCASVAYPYGDVDDRVTAAAAKAGFEVGCALPDRFDAGGPLRHPRVGVYRGDELWRFRLKSSAVVRRLWAARAVQPLVRRVRGPDG